jgi:hypothetical protein
VHRGDVHGAETLAVEAEGLALQTDSADLLPEALLSRAGGLLAADRPDEAVALIERARALFERKGNVVAARSAASLLRAQRPRALD